IMIRPRAGDFHYSKDEIDVMERDILVAKERGANGIVLGILKVDGDVDVEGTRRLVDISDPLKVDRKSTRLNSSHEWISYAVFCLTSPIHRFTLSLHDALPIYHDSTASRRLSLLKGRDRCHGTRHLGR